MLDADTKRRIDDARDTLVGKVPDPKSQVEQITIALIYKFMDDIDLRSEGLGGVRTHFAGDFARYGWTKLMSPALGGHDRLNLYAESITRMRENPGVPPLFRAIFNNAFLPYRDPETLTAFLKTIDQFDYDNSERLGDAFENLLQVMGAQGDAGQFLTPRHVIDFIVRIVDPQKHETILDPACGTAGFLISAYNHIHKANVDERGVSTLAPDDKTRMFANITGYDISPDMVRLSLANMHLHGFPDPHVYEYDTLTSEDRWNERANVILANPPFMSPKGGIRPHNRFGVQSKRSEVLFVDYIAEHLTPGGRAGVIVPEGVIFQSQNAYKQLRKMLVDDYLAAVISLPAGVFNPYSGVKTSILILDTAIARKSDSIAFCKVENDGFDLGAQRRPIDANDLPTVQRELSAYLRAARAGEPTDAASLSSSIIVDKQRIAADEYNLSAERYRERAVYKAEYTMVRLGEVCEIRKGSPITRKQVVAGSIPVVAGGQSPSAFHNVSNRTGETVTVSASGAYAGFVNYFNQPIFASDCSTIVPLDERIISKFVFHILKAKQQDIHALQVGMAQPHVYPKDVANFKIPLPPLSVQRDIVAEVEEYQRVIDGARAVVESWHPRVWVDPSWEMVELGEIADEIKAGFACGKGRTGKDGIPHLRPMNITEDGRFTWDGLKRISEEDYRGRESYALVPGDVLFNNTNSKELVGKTCLISERINGGYSNHLTRIRVSEELYEPYFLTLMLQDSWRNGAFLVRSNKWIGQAGVNVKSLSGFKIPMPPLDVQRAVVAEVDAERAMVSANRELAARMEGRVREVVGRVWGDE